MRRKRLSVLILTEDGARDGFVTWRALVLKMFRLIEPTFQESLCRFEPADEKVRAVLAGNLWLSDQDPRGHDKRVDLLKAMATRLRQEDNFVVFHFDGDRPWSASNGGTSSDKARPFEDLVRNGLRQLVRGPVAPVRGRRRLRKSGGCQRFGGPGGAEFEPEPTGVRERAPDDALNGLLLLVPYYSIEAWLYQNVEEALRICEQEGGPHHPDIENFKAWRNHRGQLDELKKPKEQTRLGSKFNLQLASNGFPAREVHRVGKSFHHAVERMKKCEALVTALASISPER